MHHGCVEHDFGQRSEPKPAPGQQSALAVEFEGKDGGHLAAILRSKRGGIEVKKQTIEVHQVVPQVVRGATPHKRAIFSKSRRRPASASAAAFPNGVMR